MAANGVSRYTLGAVFPLFTIQSKYLVHPHAHGIFKDAYAYLVKQCTKV